MSKIRPSQIGQAGASTGNALVWDGSKWAPATPTGASTRAPAFVVPGGAQLASHTFASTTESFTTDNGTLTASSGGLQLVVASDANSTILEPSGATSVTDGETCFDLVATPDPTDFGIVFRATDANNHYMLAIRCNNTTPTNTIDLFKKVSGSYSSISSSGVTIPGTATANLPMRVMIRFVGTIFTLYVNETRIAAFTDSTYSSGRSGIRAYKAGTYRFDNFQTYSLSGWPTPYAA